MTPQEWIESTKRRWDSGHIYEGSQHLAAALEEIAYIRPMLEASEAECRRREEQDLVWRTKYTLLENEIARLQAQLAQAERVVAPIDRSCATCAKSVEGKCIDGDAKFSCGGDAFWLWTPSITAVAAHSVPASRVLKDGEVAVDAERLAMHQESTAILAKMRSAIRSGAPYEIACNALRAQGKEGAL